MNFPKLSGNPSGLPFLPWFFFACFLVSLALLSYVHLGTLSRLNIGVFGLLLPLSAAFAITFQVPAEPRTDRPPLSISGMAVFLVIALLLRLLAAPLSLWPVQDEGMHGFVAMWDSEHFDISPFRLFSQLPALFFWTLALWFKAVGPSLSHLWALSTLVGFLSVPLAYASARPWLGETAARTVFFLAAFGFLPIYVGLFAHPVVEVVAFEWLTLFLLGVWWTQRGRKLEKTALAALSLAVGIGFYTHMHWPAVAFMTLVAVLGSLRTDPQRLPKAAALLLPALGCFIPLLVAALKTGYGTYWQTLWAYQETQPLLERCLQPLRYVGAIFWGVPHPAPTYSPVWGGFLNPVAGAGCLWGIVTLRRHLKEPFGPWMLASAALFFMPAFLTRSLEAFRIITLLPLLLGFTALGFLSLTGNARSLRGKIGLLLLLLGSAALDSGHLFVAYANAWKTDSALWASFGRSRAFYTAHQIIETEAARRGPGWIFTNLSPISCEQSLAVAVAPLQAPRDSHAPQPAWGALVLKEGYRENWLRRFPLSVWTSLPQDHPTDPALACVLWSPGEGPDLMAFRDYDDSFRSYVRAEIEWMDRPERVRLRDRLASLSPSSSADPYLRAFHWERLADLEKDDIHYRFYHPSWNVVGDPYAANRENRLRRMADLLAADKILSASHLRAAWKTEAESVPECLPSGKHP